MSDVQIEIHRFRLISRRTHSRRQRLRGEYRPVYVSKMGAVPLQMPPHESDVPDKLIIRQMDIITEGFDLINDRLPVTVVSVLKDNALRFCEQHGPGHVDNLFGFDAGALSFAICWLEDRCVLPKADAQKS